MRQNAAVMESRRPPLGGIILGFSAFWAGLILLFAAQTTMAIGMDWREALRGSFGLWLPWILVSPGMLMMAVLFPFSNRTWGRTLAIHVLACVAVLFVGGWLSRNVFTQPHPPRPPFPPPGRQGFPPFPGPGGPPPGDPIEAAEQNAAVLGNFLRGCPVGIPLYVTAVLVIGIMNLRRTTLERELQAAELERQLTAARLETLVSQLQPHFLFNTLNTLVSLMSTDPAQAESVVLNLSRLLRATLEARDKPLIPLRQEMELARDYIQIQQARFGEKLVVDQDISAATRQCAIPPLILQPLLENAVKYSAEKNPSGARIVLLTRKMGEKLVVEIEDSGSGSDDVSQAGCGVGLENVRARLKASFPDQKVSCDLIPNEHGGITVRIEMPAMAAH